MLVTGSDASRFRADIEGLRGVAVAMVVLYHVGVPGFSGGFVGVDVFFVLSGFLITGLLVDERSKSGMVRFGHFFARRIRRLLPASMLVFVSTVLMAVAFMPPVEAAELHGQARWVALFGANLWLARDATDYLGSTVVSPFQQYWSLALEEQFYLVWPFAVGVLAWGKPTRELRRLLIGIGVLVVGSFVLAVVWTQSRQPWAFFLLPARAWELGAGGLLAVGVRSGFKIPASLVRSVGWLGMTALAVPTILFSESTKFPGWTALLPVVGTVAVLASNVSGLEWLPLRWLGKYSYGIYLWHWPLLVVAESAAAVDLGLPMRLSIGAMSIPVAVLSFELIEHRVRFAQVLARPARSMALGASLIATALSASVLISPARVRASQPLDSGRPALPAGKVSSFVPVGVRPALMAAQDDVSELRSNGCMLEILETGPVDCAYGQTGADVVLFGDSHAEQWFPAARDAGWRLTAQTKSGCPASLIVFEYEPVGRRYVECEKWREAVLAQIAEQAPDIVILGHYSNMYVGEIGLSEWVEGLGDVVRRLSRGSTVVVLRDTPDNETAELNENVAVCLTGHLDDVDACAPNDADTDALAVAEREAVEAAGGTYVDVNTFVCPALPCPVVVGDILVYRDSNHLTATYAKSVAGEFRSMIKLTVAAGP